MKKNYFSGIFIFNQVVNDGVHSVFYWLSLTTRGKPTPFTCGEFVNYENYVNFGNF
jgi:hypothetical protein